MPSKIRPDEDIKSLEEEFGKTIIGTNDMKTGFSISVTALVIPAIRERSLRFSPGESAVSGTISLSSSSVVDLSSGETREIYRSFTTVHHPVTTMVKSFHIAHRSTHLRSMKTDLLRVLSHPPTNLIDLKPPKVEVDDPIEKIVSYFTAISPWNHKRNDPRRRERDHDNDEAFLRVVSGIEITAFIEACEYQGHIKWSRGEIAWVLSSPLAVNGRDLILGHFSHVSDLKGLFLDSSIEVEEFHRVSLKREQEAVIVERPIDESSEFVFSLDSPYWFGGLTERVLLLLENSASEGSWISRLDYSHTILTGPLLTAIVSRVVSGDDDYAVEEWTANHTPSLYTHYFDNGNNEERSDENSDTDGDLFPPTSVLPINPTPRQKINRDFDALKSLLENGHLSTKLNKDIVTVVPFDDDGNENGESVQLKEISPSDFHLLVSVKTREEFGRVVSQHLKTISVSLGASPEDAPSNLPVRLVEFAEGEIYRIQSNRPDLSWFRSLIVMRGTPNTLCRYGVSPARIWYTGKKIWATVSCLNSIREMTIRTPPHSFNEISCDRSRFTECEWSTIMGHFGDSPWMNLLWWKQIGFRIDLPGWRRVEEALFHPSTRTYEL